MKKINSLIDRLIYKGDKQNPDTYRKGRFFVVSMFILTFMALSFFPSYLGDSFDNTPLVKPLFYVSLIVLLSVFFIYPRYGHRNLLFALFALPSAISSFISVYYTTGGLYSSDIGMSLAMILFVFLVTNKTIGIISMLLHIAIYVFFYYAAINEHRDFIADLMALGADYYLETTIMCFVFATIMILLHERSKDNFLAELKKAKSEIEHQKAEIVSSITYAKRIQESKLPVKSDFATLFPDSFILFKPKDIVSGDFYYFQKKNDTVFVAAADCTGHGVPGAIMSMICSEKLEEAISTGEDLTQILSMVNKNVKLSLKQTDSDTSSRDGMDIALCAIDKTNRVVNYVGANRSLWIIRNGQNTIEETKATKAAIGGYTKDNQIFESHEVKLQPGDTLYIFTDGYADQFNGKTGKKMLTKRLKDVLLDLQPKTMQEQEKHLDEFVENWKEGTEQVDDILVIGVRL